MKSSHKISNLTVNLDNLTNEQYLTLLRASYILLMKRLVQEHKSISSQFFNQLQYLDQSYDHFVRDLNQQKLDAFVGLIKRTAYHATYFQFKKLIKNEHLQSFHLSTKQIKNIIDGVLFNECVIESCMHVIKNKKELM